MQLIREILLQTLHKEQLQVTQRFYIMDFTVIDFYEFHQRYLAVQKEYY